MEAAKRHTPPLGLFGEAMQHTVEQMWQTVNIFFSEQIELEMEKLEREEEFVQDIVEEKDALMELGITREKVLFSYSSLRVL